MVQRSLIIYLHSHDSRTQNLFYMMNCPKDAFAEEAAFISIAKFNRFMLPR